MRLTKSGKATMAHLSVFAAALFGGKAATMAEPMPQAPELRPRNGVLEATLTGAPAPVEVDGTTVRSNVFNRVYLPPVLRVRRGDEVKITLRHRIGRSDIRIDGPQPTNLHFHGMDISPKPGVDNVLIDVDPGENLAIRWRVPKDHPPGVNWYHPHRHMFTEPQILSGMSSLLVIDGYLERYYPELAKLERKTLLFKDIPLPGDSAFTLTLNGITDGVLTTRPGDYQVWEIGNLAADSFVKLAVAGHQLWVIDRDGVVRPNPQRVSDLFLPPGARAVVAIQGGNPGTYAISSLEIDTGPDGFPSPRVRVGTFEVKGRPVSRPDVRTRLTRRAQNTRDLLQPADFLRLPITRRRVIQFSENLPAGEFYINGLLYDPNRIDTRVRLGDVEEWTVRNLSRELHVFHIHQTQFLVKSTTKPNPDAPGVRDVITVPFARNGRPGEVKLIIPFTNPIMVGNFVYHCHVVGHEDFGMMANIRVERPLRVAASEDPWAYLRQLAGFGPEPGVAPPSLNDPSQICRAPEIALAK